MVRAEGTYFVLLVLVESSLSLINNTAIEARNALQDAKAVEARRYMMKKDKTKDEASTSSDTDADRSSAGSGSVVESITSVSSDSSDGLPKKDDPRTSDGKTGWKKWHRECASCPEDMKKKWRDPSINWICGAFQRARRSFKSSCMMYYRNCQDGTMFVKIHDHRCENNTRTFGDHFFYEYKVKLDGDASDKDSERSNNDSD